MLSLLPMGQHLTRLPAPTDTRNGRRRAQLNRSLSKHDDEYEPLIDSCIEATSPTRHRDHHKARARSYSAAETDDKRSRPHPIQVSKELRQKKPKKHNELGARKRPSRRKTLDSTTPHRHRNDQAEVSQPRTKLRRQPRRQRSLSSSHSPLKRTQQRERRDCIICADTRSLHRFPVRPPTVQCQHEVDVCRKCLRTWIQTEFATKIWDEDELPRMFYAHAVRRHARVCANRCISTVSQFLHATSCRKHHARPD